MTRLSSQHRATTCCLFSARAEEGVPESSPLWGEEQAWDGQAHPPVAGERQTAIMIGWGKNIQLTPTELRIARSSSQHTFCTISPDRLSEVVRAQSASSGVKTLPEFAILRYCMLPSLLLTPAATGRCQKQDLTALTTLHPPPFSPSRKRHIIYLAPAFAKAVALVSSSSKWPSSSVSSRSRFRLCQLTVQIVKLGRSLEGEQRSQATMAMPHVPIPPPPPQFPPVGFPPPGAFPAPVAVPIHKDPYMHDQPDHMIDILDDDGGYGKPRKPKKHGFVEPELKGYMLEKVEPLLGQKLSWARVGKRKLPFDEAKLESLAKGHRLRTRTGPASDYKLCTGNQRGIIDRLIAEHQRLEKQTNAIWVLHDVQRFGTWHWRSLEVKQIQVILRRQDVNATKPGARLGNVSSSYQFGEIIDLADPIPTKKKNRKNHHAHDDGLQPIDPFGPGIPALEPDHDQYASQQQPQHQMPMPMPIPMPQPGLPDPLYAPLGALPVNPGVPQSPYQPDSYGPPNPFMPQPNVMVPGQYDQHYAGDEQRWPSARIVTRSPSPIRRRSSSARRLRRLEKDVREGFDDLNRKIDSWHISSDSSEGQQENDSVFSPPRSGGSFTPPSTPPGSDAMYPRGSLHRRDSFGARRGEKRYYGNGRVEVQPAYTYQPRQGRRSPDDRRRNERVPRLHRAQTYDDYPNGRAVEPRYLPIPRVQRRLTNYEEAYPNANFGEQYRRRAGRDQYDPHQDGFQAGRREQVRYLRRRSVDASERYHR
ncbi:hypothetical protein BAUCODRAFT_22779 [Baudoinia panamericana UAMH 10762]|uniref:Uncharacterized protein n=1 Tax=Baudoinia panamericana (strain UAMH 10762) TaxID=717646 RepID=M2MMI4_BAUPA|nr:uncharacterized protein BAUCODRAFT_22779 [Baudoinia panamericana UAMH 10762]EMC97906.1 hypothetical protein BAUCODRAFT_22779 [Baudoinia panamericana UAMH 10762]